MRDDIAQVLVDSATIAQTVTRLAKKISADYAGKEVCLVCVLKGSLPFMADLMKCLTVPVRVEMLRVASYGDGTTSSGRIRILYDSMPADLSGLDVLLVEDIIDSGNTMSALLPQLAARGAASVRVCALLDKPARRVVPFQADYVGLAIPDAFVVGYGLDYQEHYRNLPYIGVLHPSVYTAEARG